MSTPIVAFELSLYVSEAKRTLRAQNGARDALVSPRAVLPYARARARTLTRAHGQGDDD
jgi:hypothetical protein